MKNFIRNTLLAIPVLALGLAYGSVYAETIRGEVIEVNQGSSYLRVNPQNQQSGLQKDIRLSVTENTKFTGAETLQDINTGDQITLDADKRDEQNWDVTSIEAETVADAGTAKDADAAQSGAAQPKEEAGETSKSDAANPAAQEGADKPDKSEASAPKEDLKGSPTGAELSQKAGGAGEKKDAAEQGNTADTGAGETAEAKTAAEGTEESAAGAPAEEQAVGSAR